VPLFLAKWGFLIFAGFYFCFAAPAPVSESVLNLRRDIKNVFSRERLVNLKAGVAIASLETGEILFELNADELLIPASVNKVLTAYVALKKLKPTSTFKTEIYITSPIREGKCSGDLYIKGGGDPSLVSERMWMLVNELIRSGMKEVSGNLVGDSSYFDQERTPAVRPKYLKDQAYNAPIGALSFNFNTTTIYVRAGETVGSDPVVYSDPENSYIDIVNHAKTTSSGTKNTLVVSRTEHVKGDMGDTVLLRGNVPVDAPEMRFYRNIVNPTLYTTHMFRKFLESRGVKVVGKSIEGVVPASARRILEFDSLPMWQVVWGMNKFSNNFVADQVLKKLGAEMWGAPGTREKGILAIQDALEDIGISKKAYQVTDGGGLSRDTQITARQILKVLTAAYRDFGLSSEFLASLGIAGEDGTLKSRFPNSSVLPPLRAKTGSLDGVTSLAGYSSSADKELLAFVILLNDSKMKYGRMTAWVDQVATTLRKFSRK